MAENKALHIVEVHGKGVDLDKLAKELSQITDAQIKLVAVSEETDKKTVSVTNSFNRLQKQYDTAYKSQQDMIRATNILNRAFEQGLVAPERYAQLIKLIEERTKTAAAANDNLRRSLSELINQRLEVKDDFGSKERAADIAAYGKALDDTRAKFNPLFAAGRQYKATLAEINQAAKVGAINEKERTDALARTKDAFAAQVIAIRNASNGNEDLGKKTRAAAQQMTYLGYQINDVLSGIASGQSPFMILSQQAGQVYQALDGPGGVSQGIRNVGNRLLEMITPARVAGVALLAAATVALVAWNRQADAQREAIRTLDGLGRGLGLTAAGFEDLARRAARAGDVSIAQAREIANQFARIGQGISPDSIERIAKVSKDFADTYTGGDLEAGLKKLNDLISGGAEGIAQWVISQRRYTLEQREAIEQAAREHDLNKAIGVMLDTLEGRLAKHKDTTSAVADSWDRIKKAVSDVITAFGPYVDRFLAITAGFIEQVAKGAAVVTGGASKITEVSAATTMGATSDINAGLNPAVKPAEVDASAKAVQNLTDKMKGLTPEFEKAQKKSAELETGIKRLGSDGVDKLTKATEDNQRAWDAQQSSLLSVRASLEARRDATTANSDAMITFSKALDDVNNAFKSNDVALRNNVIQQAKQTIAMDDASAAVRRQNEERERLAGRAEDVAQKFVTTTKAVKDYGAEVKAINDYEAAGGRVTKEMAEARSRATQAIESQKDANGELLTQAQRAAEMDDIALQSIRARTTAERAAVAVRQTTAQQRGQEIEGLQALAQQQAAATRVREEDRMKIVDLSRDLGMESERIKTERDLLFASSEARARVIAQLQAEQNLRRQGVDKNVPGFTEAVKKAGDVAVDDLGAKTVAKGWEDAKRAVGDFASSFASDMANGVKAAEALANAAKKVGQSLVSSGATEALTGLLSQNYAQAGIGAAKVGIGFALESFGPSEKAKQRKQEMLDAWAKAQEDELAAIQKQQQATIDAGLAAAKAGADAARVAEQAARAAADAAEEAARRIQSYEDRLFAATNKTDTLEGALAAFDRQADQQRAAEVAAGGQGIAQLEAALAAERLNIISDFAQKAADAEVAAEAERLRIQQEANEAQIKAAQDAAEAIAAAAEAAARAAQAAAQRAQSYQQRLFMASIDTSTLAGRLAAFDYQSQIEIQQEYAAGGQAINDLVAAQAAERLRIEKDFYAQSQQQLQDFYDRQRQTIQQFIDNLQGGSASTLAPGDRLAAAQAAFNQQVSAGAEASTLTQYASNLLDAARAMYASGPGYQAVYNQVIAALQAAVGKAAVAAAAGTSTAGNGALGAAANANAPAAPPIPVVTLNFGDVVSELKMLRADVGAFRTENGANIANNTTVIREGIDITTQAIEDASAAETEAIRLASMRADALAA